MGSVKLPYLVQDVDRHGNVRTYVRRPGRPKVRIRHPVGSVEFMIEYAAAVGAGPKVEMPAAGTFRALCVAYYGSKTFRGLDRATQKWRRRALDRVCAKHGDKPVALMQPRHVRNLRNELEDQPNVANQRLHALKALFKWAVDHDHTDRNPAREIDPISVPRNKGFHTWTIEEVEQFEARWPIGTRERLAMALLLYTAGRREDAVRLGPQHVRHGRIRFTQAKNEHRNPIDVDLPLHPDLKRVIAGSKVGQLVFLTTQYGRPFSHSGFGNWFRNACRKAGVPGRAHGLRKALATRLADQGATPHEIMAWTGHTTLEEVERYTKAAKRRGAADVGLVKLQRKNKSGIGKVPPRRSKVSHRARNG